MPHLQKQLLGYVFDKRGLYRQPTKIETFNDLAEFLMEAGKGESHVRITTVMDEYVWDSDEVDAGQSTQASRLHL